MYVTIVKEDLSKTFILSLMELDGGVIFNFF